MRYINRKPYKVIWFSIPLVVILSMFKVDSSLDVHLHNTYYVVHSIHIGIILSVMLGIIGLIYWILRNVKLINWLTTIHTVNTTLTFCIIALICSIYSKGSDFEYFYLSYK